jgi:hypothetical protein
VPVFVEQQVPVMPVFDLQEVGHDGVTSHRLYEVAARLLVPTGALRKTQIEEDTD